MPLVKLCLMRTFAVTEDFSLIHVGPDFRDMSQTFGLRAALIRFPPSQRILSIGKPNRILLFLVQNDFVEGVIGLSGLERGYLFRRPVLIPMLHEKCQLNGTGVPKTVPMPFR